MNLYNDYNESSVDEDVIILDDSDIIVVDDNT